MKHPAAAAVSRSREGAGAGATSGGGMSEASAAMIPAVRHGGRDGHENRAPPHPGGRDGDILARMHRAWIVPALALACARENPGFVLAGDDGASTGGTSTASGAGATTTTTTDATATTSDTTGEPAPLCPIRQEPALDLQFSYMGAPLEPAAGCPPVKFRGNGQLSTNALTLIDDGLCFENLAGTFTLEVGYVNIMLPILDGCFEVELAWTPDCSAVRSALLSYVVANQPLLLAVGVIGSELAPSGAPPELSPRLVLADACSCDPEAGPCCVQGDGPGPGAYGLNFEALGVSLRPGETAEMIAIGDANYNLANLRSHVHADCVEPPLHLDWYAVRVQ